MSEDVPLTPATKKLLLGMLVLLIPIFGVFGWVIYGLTRPAEPCPLCDAVASEDADAVDRALAGGTPVTEAAWAAALGRVGSIQDREGPQLRIARLLLDHGASPEYSWTGVLGGQASATGASIRLGDTTVGGGSSSSSTRRRYFAAALVAGDTDDASLIGAFLEKGLDPKGQAAGEALVVAAMKGHVNVVKRLLAAGVSPNYVASQPPRRTALAEAIQTRRLDVIAALEAAGAREW